MPKSRVTILVDGQSIELEGSTPSVRVSDVSTMVLLPEADGKVTSSSIRAFQDKFDVQSLQTPPNSWVLLQKISS